MCGRKRRSLGRYMRLTAWEMMTGKAHENKRGFNTVSQTISHLLYFTLETISVHLQAAAFSRTANSTSFTYIVCCIKKIHHTDVSMPGEKMVEESPTLISCVRESSSKTAFCCLRPWLQPMCVLICICRCQSECQAKTKAKTAKKTHANLPLV